MQGQYAENLNWKQVEAEFKSGALVVIPIGAGCKEHGLHLPMSTDKIVAEYLAEQMVQSHHVLIMPTLTYSRFPAFTDYAGSISLDTDVCTKMFVTMCEQWAEQGAEKFYFLNWAISTNRSLEPAKQRLARLGVEMAYTDLFEYSNLVSDIEQQKGGTHAEEIETSIMLHIKPEVVKMELACEDFDDKPGKLTPNPDDPDPKAAYSPTGVWGNPTLATKEKGKIAVERLINFIGKDIELLCSPGLNMGGVCRF